MSKHPPKPLRPLVLALHLACLGVTGAALGLPTAAQAQDAAFDFAIPAGPLQSALTAFSAQTRINVSFIPEIAGGGRHSPGVQGRYSAEQALGRLLAGSGLVAVRQGNGYTLERAPGGDAAVLAPVTVSAAVDRSGATEGSGSYTTRSTKTATKLDLTQRETPQSVTVITRQQMDDQGLTGIADALRQAPGITVNRDNTEGYSFYARGFQVENFQFDGVSSLSSAGGNVRDNYSITDSAIYDRVEILKGATGLVNGSGYPSGVVNLVRKRPTADFQGHASIGAGSWDNYRSEVDLSSPLTADGRIRGRLVAAVQDSRSFIDYLKTRQELVYGIVEADLAASTTLSLGVNVQKNKGDATTNAHLPAFYSDGTPARLSRSTNAADRWSYRDQDTQHLFATLEHDFGSGWNLKAHVGQRKYTSREVIAGISGTINATTHSVAHGYIAGTAARFDTDTTEDNFDLQLSGQYSLLGREHKLVLGYTAAHTKAKSSRSDGATDASIPDAFQWNNNATEPGSYNWWWTPTVTAHQKIAYLATVLKPTDRLSLILGARATDYSWKLDSVFASNARASYSTDIDQKVIPYAGITFDIDQHHTVYASYTDVFKPQAYSYDANERQLDPLTGESYEIGAKGSYYGGRLNASVALFQLEQDNYAVNDPSGAMRPSGGVAQVAMQGVTTKGVELELFGEVLPGWQLGSGITYIQPRDADGHRVSATQPERLFKLSTLYRLPGALHQVSVGGNVQWQSGTYFNQTIAGASRRFEQPGYAVVGLVATVQLNARTKATFNIDNLFDKHYYAGIGSYNTVYWGAPRSVMANLRYEF